MKNKKDIESKIVDLVSSMDKNMTFRNIVDVDGAKYHYSFSYSVFKPQLYRVLSLMANSLGIKALEYDYIKSNSDYITYCKSMVDGNQVLYEKEM